MKQTKFFEIHKSLNAKLVDFAGYAMPVQYSSILQEHKAVRTAAGVFDVSHMGEVYIRGEHAQKFVQKITVNDVTKLFPGRVQYSAMCYHDGGIVDDLLVYCISDKEYFLVINASNIEKDYNWMVENNTDGVEIDNQSDAYSLLAVQGPNSGKIVEKVFNRAFDIEYYHFTTAQLYGFDFIVSRTGYTGELGYELYFKGDAAAATTLWNDLFAAGAELGIQPVGLGARDTLRLEMGFCLYGNDIDATTNPLEAGLSWITRLNKPAFNGKDALTAAKSEGLKRKLTPLTGEEKFIPRHGCEVFCDGKKAGVVTSGSISPMLDKPVALAYIDTEVLNSGKPLFFVIRGKEYPAVIVKLPFVER
ncbi:MAG: glycine cleavage system aminomethyltransferase GcvT [Ignavibacteriales bacterium]|nr:glycine cleavage system aminomethyltransferase GcvT [Ignavibacteriales bacterium]